MPAIWTPINHANGDKDTYGAICAPINGNKVTGNPINGDNEAYRTLYTQAMTIRKIWSYLHIGNSDKEACRTPCVQTMVIRKHAELLVPKQW